MTPSQIERLQAEHDELADRLAKLTAFINYPTTEGWKRLAFIDQDLLRAQQALMINYLGILTMRLNRVSHG